MWMKIYRFILWFLGFKKSEYITYHLRRQRQRLGWLWFLLVGTTQGFLVVVLHRLPEWLFYILVFVVCQLVVALVYHVGDKPQGKEPPDD